MSNYAGHYLDTGEPFNRIELSYHPTPQSHHHKSTPGQASKPAPQQFSQSSLHSTQLSYQTNSAVIMSNYARHYLDTGGPFNRIELSYHPPPQSHHHKSTPGQASKPAPQQFSQSSLHSTQLSYQTNSAVIMSNYARHYLDTGGPFNRIELSYHPPPQSHHHKSTPGQASKPAPQQSSQSSLHSSQLSYQSMYGELLNAIEDLGRAIKPSYTGNKMSQERLKRGIAEARVLIRECLKEVDKSASQ